MGTLTINRVTPEMAGAWTCVAENLAGTSMDSIEISVGSKYLSHEPIHFCLLIQAKSPKPFPRFSSSKNCSDATSSERHLRSKRHTLLQGDGEPQTQDRMASRRQT